MRSPVLLVAALLMTMASTTALAGSSADPEIVDDDSDGAGPATDLLAGWFETENDTLAAVVTLNMTIPDVDADAVCGSGTCALPELWILLRFKVRDPAGDPIAHRDASYLLYRTGGGPAAGQLGHTDAEGESLDGADVDVAVGEHEVRWSFARHLVGIPNGTEPGEYSFVELHAESHVMSCAPNVGCTPVDPAGAPVDRAPSDGFGRNITFPPVAPPEPRSPPPAPVTPSPTPAATPPPPTPPPAFTPRPPPPPPAGTPALPPTFDDTQQSPGSPATWLASALAALALARSRRLGK